MKSLIVLLILSTLLIFSCGNGDNRKVLQENNKDSVAIDSTCINCSPPHISENKIPDKSLIYSGIDTILKYEHLDTAFDADGFFLSKANGIKFALCPTTDSTSDFYQNVNGKWINTFMIKNLSGIERFRMQDMNGDGIKDLILIAGYTGMGGNEEDVVLLYSKQTRLFMNTWQTQTIIGNVNYNQKKHFIESSWRRGGNPMSRDVKEIYQARNDSIILLSGVSIGAEDEATAMDTSSRAKYTIKLYKNDLYTPIKTIKGSSGRLRDIFDTTFWDSSNEN